MSYNQSHKMHPISPRVYVHVLVFFMIVIDSFVTDINFNKFKLIYHKGVKAAAWLRCLNPVYVWETYFQHPWNNHNRCLLLFESFITRNPEGCI